MRDRYKCMFFQKLTDKSLVVILNPTQVLSLYEQIASKVQIFQVFRCCKECCTNRVHFLFFLHINNVLTAFLQLRPFRAI